MIGIYKITNLINNKCYIGQSVDINRRFSNHKSYKLKNSDYPLYQAFRKYGIENFSFEVIEECSIAALDEREIYWIDYFDSYYHGYNQTTGGNSGNKNNVIKISKEDIELIYYLLMYSPLSQKEIAEMFEVGQDTISEINHGKTRINPKLSYPLRQYKGNKKQYFCEICGKEINRKAKHCIECSNKLRRVAERPSREELKDLIRNKPFTQIASQFGVSDNAIRKWCNSMNLPRTKKDINSYSDEEWNLI